MFKIKTYSDKIVKAPVFQKEQKPVIVETKSEDTQVENIDLVETFLADAKKATKKSKGGE